MENVFVFIVAFISSLLTFFSGFGLATILMPVLAFFVPVPIAIILTAIVHFFHNALRSIFLWMNIQWKIVAKFSITSIPATILGAFLLKKLSFVEPLATYLLLGTEHEVTILKIAIGLLFFAIATVAQFFEKALILRNIYLGGLLSGLIGGFSGNQGAIRSAYLITMKQNPNSYIATNSMIAVIVDVVRLVFYSLMFSLLFEKTNISLLTVSLGGALLGIILGMFFLKSVTIIFIKRLVVILLYLFGLLMISGII